MCAKIMDFIDDSGVTHPGTYWYPRVKIQMKDPNSQVIEFHGYRDKSARDAGLDCLSIKRYIVTGADFDAYFSDAVFDKSPTNPSKQSYAYAMTAGDTLKPGYTLDRAGYRDPQGNIVTQAAACQAFFSSATDQ